MCAFCRRLSFGTARRKGDRRSSSVVSGSARIVPERQKATRRPSFRRLSNGDRQWTERKNANLSASLNEVFQDTGSVVVAHYAGLTVAQIERLSFENA